MRTPERLTDAAESTGASLFDPASERCGSRVPTTLLRSSREAGWTTALVEWRRSPQRQDAYETHPTSDQTIVVGRRGALRIESLRDGRWHQGTYGAGSVGTTPGGQTSRLRWSTPTWADAYEAVHLYLPQAILREAAEEHRRAGQPLPDAPISVLAYDDPVVARVAEAMLDGVAAGAPDLYCAAAARWLATHLLFRHSFAFADGRNAGTIPDPRLARVLDYMAAHLAEPLTLDRLAKEAGVSKFHFSRLFRERTGETPHGRLMRLRLARAATLLADTDLRVEQVAEACGFRRATHFATAFARCHGASPRAYRARRRH